MQAWLIVLMTLSGATVAFNLALIAFPRNRFLDWLTRPIRARIMMRFQHMDYRKARAITRVMDIRDRRR